MARNFPLTKPKEVGGSNKSSQLVDEFIADFCAMKNDINDEIESIPITLTASEVNDRLSKISIKIQSLSKVLHDATFFLPSFLMKVVLISRSDYNITTGKNCEFRMKLFCMHVKANLTNCAILLSITGATR